jgi:hypothetical protein
MFTENGTDRSSFSILRQMVVKAGDKGLTVAEQLYALAA